MFRTARLVGVGWIVAWALTVAADSGAAPVAHTVTIDGFEFRPAAVTVKQGETVEWRNADPVPHTATSKVGGFDSGSIAANGAWRFTAARKGRFDYTCTFHPVMKGTLIVE